MNRFRISSLALMLIAGLLSACGDESSSGALDGGPDATVPYCAGLPDGTPCGDPTVTACSGADTCLAGACVKNDLPAATACGDATDTACNAADTCDGAGMCLPNFATNGTACGDPTSTTCNGADTCNGSGVCVANLADSTTPCGDTTETDCNHADTCNGLGTCVPNLADIGAACGDATNNECNLADTCDGAGACLSNFIGANTACGDATSSECTAPDTCDGAGTCAANHVVASTPCGSPNDTECDDPDVCDGAGACATNVVAAGTPCGDATNTSCNAADTCDGTGACDTHLTADGTACYDCAAAGPGLCDVCTTGVCNVAPYCWESGTTLQASSAAGNNHRGNMFDLVATNTVTITAFDASPMGNTTIEIYYKVGTWNGFANTPSAWTKIGSAAVGYTGAFVRVPLTVNVTIPAGQTYAFYVTSNTTAVALNYSNGSGVGNVYSSDANLTFLEGGGMEYPFTAGTGAVYQPRIWNGAIHYILPNSPSVISTLAADYQGGVSAGVMFDMQASDDTMIRGTLDVELEAGTHDVDVYFRRGSFVGHEGSNAGWVRVGGGTGIVSAGGGALSSIAIESSLLLTTGEIGALYVDTHGTGLRTSPGTAVGDPVVTAGALTIGVGSAIDADFGGIGAAAIFRGSFQNPICE